MAGGAEIGVLGRLASGGVVLLLVSLLAFGLLGLAPGDPARLILSATGVDLPTPDEVAAKRAALRLDDPLYLRYLTWAQNAFQGDFGQSYRTGRSVSAMYAERMPATLGLAALAVTLTLLVAVPLGVLAAVRCGSWLDALTQGVVVLGAAVPAFWLALLLILIFSATLRWLPALGSFTLPGMALPAVVLALPNIAVLARLVRAATLDALRQQYMTTARAKGYGARGALWVHAMPNVLATVLTAILLEIAYLLTGTVIVETVFAYPGVGRLAVDAALVGDMPVLALCVLAAAVIYVGCGWLADLGVAWLDPRVR